MKKIAIVGGGASGMAAAVMLKRRGQQVVILERGARLGRKLSATGNGQGNVTNRNMNAEFYFTDKPDFLARALQDFDDKSTVAFLESLGGIFQADSRGRVYPCGRQASAVTDLLRRELSRLEVPAFTDRFVTGIAVGGGKFTLTGEGFTEKADAVVLATGGKAAENFGTDGNGYALAKSFGHTLTPLKPALVQLRCEQQSVRGFKGVRVDGGLTVTRGGKAVFGCRGDILFLDGGVSGDAVFRASSYTEEGDKLLIDFLPDISRERLYKAIDGATDESCLLCVVNNGLGRALYRKSGGNEEKLVSLLKEYPVTVTGTFGFDRAQVTRGGVPLSEVDGHLMSKKQAGLYLAGELLNVDGACGGYNLQWAFTSAHCIAEDFA